MTDIAEAVDYTRPTITKTVDVLSRNDFLVEERDGSRRLVHRDRLTRPDEHRDVDLPMTLDCIAFARDDFDGLCWKKGSQLASYECWREFR